MTGAHPAFDKLRAEHRLLLATVDAFEVFVAKRARDTNAAKDFATFVEFLRETDHSHHQKEERALDPFLIKCGFTWDAARSARCAGSTTASAS